MKLIRMLLFAILLILVNSSINARTFVTIESFELWSNTYTDEHIRVAPPIRENPDNCADPDSYMVDTTLPFEIKNRIYSTLLTAVVSKSPVRVVLDGCEWNRPKIITVLIK